MMPEPSALHVDFDMAREFLTALDETAESFTFQTFDDNKARKDRALAAVFSGDFEDVKSSLAGLNRRGAGAFVTVNETDGKGRRLENITRYRAVWHEDDEGHTQAFPLRPHIVVESSPGKRHSYWLVDGLSAEQFRGVMDCMVRTHRSDPNARDPARVLRLPGFHHQKDPASPFLVRILDESGEQAYPADELLRAFPPPPPEQTKPPETAGQPIDRAKLQEIRSALAFINPTDRDDWLAVGMALHSTGAGNQAFGIWDEWAQKTEKGNYEPVGQRRTWDSFGKRAGRVTTLATLFELAKQSGWVKPGPPRQSAPVTDISDENALRLAYEKRIGEADGDLGQLLYAIVPEVLNAAMREATRSHLIKLLSERTGVPKGQLRADMPKRPRRHDDDGAEKPSDFVSELNQRHAVVPVGGRTLILNREYDPGLRRKLVTFSSRPDFVMRYENRQTRRAGEEVDIGTYWLKSLDRNQHEGIVFMPGGSIPNYYNLWTGWGIQPKGGDCSRFVDFVHQIICGGSSARFAYVWGWMAHLFQRPQELPGTCLVLRGAQGIGKNRFAEAMGRLVGAHFIALSSINQVTGRFSGHLADALLVFANEAIWGGDKSAEGALKAMITDPYSAIEAKGKDIRSVPNYKRLIVASNEDWVVPRGKGDRRFVILDVSAERKEDRAYFGALMKELKSGGYAALMHELMAADLSNFEPARIPEDVREAGWELAVRSGNSMERWWYDVLQRGYLYYDEPAYADPDTAPASGHIWPVTIECDRVKEFYLKWCERQRVPHPESVETLGKALHQFGLRRKRKSAEGHRPWVYQFPELADAQGVYGALMGIPAAKWSADDA
jgi:hypothetical protein